MEFLYRLKNELIKFDKTLHGWEISSLESTGIQRLYESAGKTDRQKLICHQDRMVRETSFSLTVYTQHSSKMGVANTLILPHLDISEQIREAVQLSSHAQNKPWHLPVKPDGAYPDVITCDPEIKSDPKRILELTEEKVNTEISALRNIRINSAELFVNTSVIQRVTSTGIATQKDQSDIYFEIAMEKAGSVNDKEVHENISSVTAKDLNLEKFFANAREQVYALDITSEPVSSNQAVIIVDEMVIASLLQALARQTYASMEYHKFPHLKQGDLVFTGDKHPESDCISVFLDPHIPAMSLSTPYTGEGLITTKGDLIREDKVLCQITDHRYGEYLGKKANGLAGNMIVPQGQIAGENFRKENGVIEILKFSSLLIDEMKLTWSSEIKLAKEYSDKGVRLIKGGVVSGNLKENLAHCFFSSETAVINRPGMSYEEPLGYIGPARMMIRRGVSIAGL